jgi:5-methylcytosine-specific restriction protein A
MKRTDGPSAAVRIRVYKRDRFACTYCGVPGTEAELEVDHIIAVAKGGSHHISNLTTACRACNQAKGTKDLKPGAEPRKTEKITPRSPEAWQTLVGMYLHTFDVKKELEWQGKITAVDGDICLVQLYGWMFGDATNTVVIPKEDICSHRVRLYATSEQWMQAAERYNRQRCARDGTRF